MIAGIIVFGMWTVMGLVALSINSALDKEPK